jgi:multiple sugar transport system ATP-binding protein
MIAGLEEVTYGNIYIGSRLVNDVAPKDRDIAMVFQSYALYPHMNVYDNMAFGLKLRHVPKPVLDRRVKDAAEILGLTPLLRRKPKELSGGQRQRVAVGRAIVREPKVFLMDEPLSNLDAKLRVQMRAELIKLHQRLQTTIVYVTHDQVEAMTMGSRIAVLRDGILQQLDSPRTLFDHPANMFVAAFIGSPSMNFFPAALKTEREEMFVEGAGFRLKLPAEKRRLIPAHHSGDVVLGMRPEYLKPRENGQPVDGNMIKARVDVVETLGSEAISYLQAGDRTFLARTAYIPEIRPGMEIDVLVDTDRLHLFDPQTEEALSLP